MELGMKLLKTSQNYPNHILTHKNTQIGSNHASLAVKHNYIMLIVEIKDRDLLVGSITSRK